MADLEFDLDDETIELLRQRIREVQGHQDGEAHIEVPDLNIKEVIQL